MDQIGTFINWIFSFSLIKSSYLIFFGSLAVVIGGWRNTYEQNVHNETVTAANKVIQEDTLLLRDGVQASLKGITQAEEGIGQTLIEIGKTKDQIQESANYLTGGDASAIMLMTSVPNGFMILNESDKYPLYKTMVNITEYWWPDDGKELPPDYWTLHAKYWDSLGLYAPYRDLVLETIDKLYPKESRLVPLIEPRELNKSNVFADILFPDSHVVYYKMSISSQSSSILQYQTLRLYKAASGNTTVRQSSLFLRNGPNGSEPFGNIDEKWKKIPIKNPYTANRSNPNKLGHYLRGDYYYQYDETFTGGGEVYFRDW